MMARCPFRVFRTLAAVLVCSTLVACGGSTSNLKEAEDPFAEMGSPVRTETIGQTVVDFYRPTGDWQYSDSQALFLERSGDAMRVLVGAYRVPTRDIFVRYEAPNGCWATLFVYLPDRTYPDAYEVVAAHTVGAVRDVVTVNNAEVFLEPSMVGEGDDLLGIAVAADGGEGNGPRSHYVMVTYDGTWIYKARVTSLASEFEQCMEGVGAVIDSAFPMPVRQYSGASQPDT